MWTIRPATPSDSIHAVSVVKAVFLEFGFSWDDGEYTQDLRDLESGHLQRGGFWIAEDAGRVIGCAGLHVHDETCSLERLYVLREHRGTGLGRALFQTTIDEARARGCKVMEIWSDKQFVDAHRLYQKFGAIVVGERICPNDPDESPEWGMEIELIDDLRS